MGLEMQEKLSIIDKIKAPKPQDKKYNLDDSKPLSYNNGCQTIYRESEAQTVPWTPPYNVLQSTTPEILTLACLSFHNGLLVSKQDIEILYRLRLKREWEKYLTYIYTPENEEFRLKIINEIERSEWEFREKEIQKINELRMELAHKQMMEQRMIIQERMNYRMQRARERFETEKRDKLPKIKAAGQRALRRVHQQQLGLNKFRKRNIIDRFTHPTSNLCTSLAMLGRNPVYEHEKLCIDPRPREVGDIYNALWKSIPTNLPSDMIGGNVKKHCCKRLKLIHLPKKILPENAGEYDRASKVVEKVFKEPHKCVLGEIDEKEEKTFKNTVLLQSLIKGRAVQSMVLRQLKSHRDLACELKSTTFLYPKDKERKLKRRKEILMEIRDFNIVMRRKGNVIGVIEKLEGHCLSTMLDYTSKALVRYLEEKRAHIFALAAEKERWAREYGEAGRRQHEEIRQRQHEEIYKQVLKTHEITSDIFLEQTLDEQVKDTSKSIATVWAEKHSADVDEVIDLSQLEEFEKMEHIAKLSNQHLLDKEKKNRIRDEIKAKTAVLRKYAESVIYGIKDDLVEVESTTDDSGSSLMRKLEQDDKEDKEWDEFYDEMLKDTPEVKQVLTGNIDKIQLYDNPALVKRLLGKNIGDGTKPPGHEKETFFTELDKIAKIESEEGSNGEEEEEEGEEEVQSENVDEMHQEKLSLISPSLSSIISEEKKEDEAKGSISEESSSSSNMFESVNREDVKVLQEILGDPATSDISESSVDIYESSEQEIGSQDLEIIKKRREIFKEEDKANFFKRMAEKLIKQITGQANTLIRHIQEIKKVTDDMPVNVAKADALVQAYKIVSRALIKCSQNVTEDCLRGSLSPWLDTVLGEAEKRVFELFDSLHLEKEVPDEVPQVLAPVQEKVEGLENIIEEITGPSQERLALITEEDIEERIFKEPFYWCPEVKYSGKDKKVKTKAICLQKSDSIGDFDEYEGILDEKNFSYLADESHIEKPLTVIKSRRGHHLGEDKYHDNSNDSY